MWNSDSDSDCCEEYVSCRRMKSKQQLLTTDNVKLTTFNPSDDAVERWSTIPDDIRMLALMRMKLCAFWLPILLERDNSSPMAQWALEVGLINSNPEISMKQLQRIEIVEAILRALEKGTLYEDQTKNVFFISNMLNLCTPGVFEDAVLWLEQTGEFRASQKIEDFGHQSTGYTVLLSVFTEFCRFIYKMGTNLQRTMNTLLVQPSSINKEKCEEWKKKGNEKFQSQQFEEAVKFYSKAIKFNPENFKVYGNRALCFIRSKKYLEAVGDGKRAVLIDPYWAKGHYRYCEALFCLGELKMAILANQLGRDLCRTEEEGYRDLVQQHKKFMFELQQAERRPTTQTKQQESAKKPQTNTASAAVNPAPLNKVPEVKTSEKQEVKTNKQPVERRPTTLTKQQESAKKPQTNTTNAAVNPAPLNKVPEVKTSEKQEVKTNKQPVEKRPTTPSKQQESAKKPQKAETSKLSNTTNAAANAAPLKKVPEVKTSEKPEVKTNKQPVKNEKISTADGGAEASKTTKSELPKPAKVESNTPGKKKSKNKNLQSEDENSKAVSLKVSVCKELKSVVQDAHTALTDLRSRNAEQAFSQALAMVEANNLKELGLSTLDVLLLLYGRASALTEIGQPEELGEAQKLLEKMKTYEERRFQCLVFYAIGRVYLRENRFKVALEQFLDSLQMVKNQITPGKLTWPLTKDIVKETQPDYFKGILDSSLEQCRFPPAPDAVCRLVKCHGSSKSEIYFTDPDFKGFIRISCCQSCTVEYHITCWKTMKTSPVFEKSDKDFLHETCFTPDCVGKICRIKIYSPTGLVKCTLEDTIPRPETPKKPKVNQECTSLKKLKSKSERKLKRKHRRRSFKEQQEMNDEILPKKEDPTQNQQKAWLLYRDRVLLQINQNMELLREEKGVQVSLTRSLKPWLELDESRGNQVAQRMLSLQQEQPDSTLGQTVELLLERKNRVWARVFIEVLSGCPDINPKLNKWACQLNNAGLDAARSFIERHAGHLEQLDLSFLLNFSPLQSVIIDKLGTKPELFPSIGLTVTDYLKQAPPHDTRLFIWTLEEHRESYDSCHTILDEYFDMMDGHCSVLKKSDENQNNSPMKSRGRKKKGQKGVYVIPLRTAASRNELDQDYFEDDTLSFLHPSDPFSVPSHLREQVADFEEQFYSRRHQNYYNNILDNYPDLTKESLYDYFAQILDEHGPLVPEDHLLVGQLKNFPPEAQLKIQEAGGFEQFLLESLRFIKIRQCIGLAKHAVSLQDATHETSLDSLDNLDDLDDLVDPGTNHPFSDLRTAHEAAFTPHQDTISSAQTQHFHILPNPYNVFVFGPNPLPPPPSARRITYPGNNGFSPWTPNDQQQQTPYFVPNDDEEIDLYCSDSEEGLMETDSSSGGVASMRNKDSLLKIDAAVQTCQETMRSVAVNTEVHERFENYPGFLMKKQKKIKVLKTQIEEMSNSEGKVDLKHQEEISALEEEIQKVTANVQVTNTELGLFQQKLEEEVKKDQNEKKANQEVLKSLKVEIEDLVEEHRSLNRNIRDTKSSYDTKLRDFLELSNQSAAEKMSLEDEISHCRSSLASAVRRSKNAQLSVVESRRNQSLHGLFRELSNNKALLTKLEEAMHKYPNKEVEMARNAWRAGVQEMEKRISSIDTQFKEMSDQVMSGKRVNELCPPANGQTEAADGQSSSADTAAAVLSSAGASSSSPTLIQQTQAPPAPAAAAAPPAPAAAAAPPAPAAPPSTQTKPPARSSAMTHSNTVFDKAIERLTSIFPDHTRSELSRFMKDFRSSSGGSLSSMSLQDVVGGVSRLILDHQEKLSLAAKSGRAERGASAPPSTAWQAPGPQRSTQPNALNVEDPCIICHDDMSPEDVCVLECRHSFHHECIRSWLKEQSTCPTCRDHALLPDDFPALTSRRRQAP